MGKKIKNNKPASAGSVGTRSVDLESGVSSLEEKEEIETEYVGTTLTPAKKLEWEARIGTKPWGPSGHYNPHGMLAGQRFVAEKFACEILMQNEGLVIDVGAAPHRTWDHLGQRGRFLMPRVHAGDNTRVGRAPKEAKEFICHHRFEECRCWDGEKRSLLFTHSAYYIEPMALWKSIMEDNVMDVVVVEHEFTDFYGGFYDEASWSLERDVVTMKVTGNAFPYVHTLPPWQCGWVGGDGESFQVDVLKVLDGVTRVVRIEPIKVGTDTKKSLTWTEIEADPVISGPVQFSSSAKAAVADNARFTRVTFDVHNVKKFGPVLYTDYLIQGEKVSVTLPLNMVSAVATLVVNRPRDDVLFSEVNHVMKQRYARSRVPPSKLPSVLTAAIALGFVVNLPFEVNTQYSMLDKFTWTMKVHSTLLKFGSVTVRRWPWFVGLIILTLVWLIPVEVFENDPIIRAASAISAVALFMLGVFCVRGCFRAGEIYHDYKVGSWVSSIGSDEGPTAPLLGHAQPIRKNFPLPGSRYIRSVPMALEGTMTLTTTREKVQEPERTLVSGVVADGAMPLVLATTQAAEASAVGNRILAHRDNPTEESLAQMARSLSSVAVGAIQDGVDMTKTAFDKWVKKLKESYPLVYVENMYALWMQWQGATPPPEGTKGFLKVEKSAATVGVDGGKAVKPRLIQPPTDLDKAMTGYVVTQLYDAIREAWDGIKTPILYASGRSLRYVGARVDDFINTHQAVTAWSVDMATYDATLCLQIQEVAFKLYEKMGVPAWWFEWIKRIRTRGRTPNGVTYCPYRYYRFADEKEAKAFADGWRKKGFRVKGPIETVGSDGEMWFSVQVEDFQMTSGRADTNLTDTVCLALTFIWILEAAKIPYLLLVCGDDAFLLLRKGDEGVVPKIQEHQRALGMKPEGKVSDERADWEFCSKLFWYVKDGDKDVTVLGSKPFRGIARMGVNTTLPGAANAAAAAQAVRVDSGHVPFLGAFADRTYELCRDKRIKPVGRAEWTSMRGDKRYGASPLNYTITQARYGLGKESEDQFKNLLSGLNSVPIVCQYAPLADAIRRDEE